MCSQGDNPQAPQSQQGYGSVEGATQKEPQKNPLPPKFEAFHFVRLAASTLIVFRHFHQELAPPQLAYASAGVNFFFVLAGFGPAISKLRRAWPGTGKTEIWPAPATLQRRFASVYPMYLCALLAMVPFDPVFKPKQLLVEIVMLQGWHAVWSPFWNYHTFYNIPLWFCSALAFLWLTESATFAAASAVWRTKRPLTYTCLMFVLWIFASPFSGWSVWAQTWPVMKLLSRSPLQYYNQYAAGVALAFLLRQRRLDEVPPSSCFASAALGMLALLVCLDPELLFAESGDYGVHHAVKKSGIMTPLFCLLILGLAEGVDPVSRLLGAAPFTWAKPVAFGVYALQAPVVRLTKPIVGPVPISFVEMSFVVVPVLLFVAYLTQRFVQEPGQEVILRLGSGSARTIARGTEPVTPSAVV